MGYNEPVAETDRTNFYILCAGFDFKVIFANKRSIANHIRILFLPFIGQLNGICVIVVFPICESRCRLGLLPPVQVAEAVCKEHHFVAIGHVIGIEANARVEVVLG